MPKGIYKRTEWHNKINSLGHFGLKHTEEQKKNISLALKGRMPKNVFTGFALKGEKSYNWRGQEVKYRGLHSWVERVLGKPSNCEFCAKIGHGH